MGSSPIFRPHPPLPGEQFLHEAAFLPAIGVGLLFQEVDFVLCSIQYFNNLHCFIIRGG